MPHINHLRRWVPPRTGQRSTVETFAVNSFVGAVDPEFDNLQIEEEKIVERLKDRGKF